jgi:Flp pilus assembly protein TadG
VTAPRARAQSLVELALVAPILILLAMAAWDGGSVLREQVVLQQAARDGARVAATDYDQNVPNGTICDAVKASAANLPGLTCAPSNVTYPSPDTVQVRLTYAHALITPVLRQLWAGGLGSVSLAASATFYVPQLTPVPGTVLPSTPTLTPTPTPTLAPTLTPTPTPTLVPTLTPTPGISTCRVLFSVPRMIGQQGYWFVAQLSVPSYLDATWNLAANGSTNADLYIYSNTPSNPFAGQPDPTGATPPNGALASKSVGATSVEVRTPGSNLSGSFSVYFYNRTGKDMSASTAGTIEYQSRHCP